MNKDRIYYFDKTLPLIKYYSRKNKTGKEHNMIVSSFESVIDIFFKNSELKVAVFIEPCLGTGYPDIVFVEYDENIFLESAVEIEELDNIDLALLFEISRKKTISVSKLEDLLGYNRAKILKSITELNRLNLISIHDNIFRINKEMPYFRINRVISIEAKIDKWNEAIEQANNNSQFSTESYIMLNKDKCSDIINNRCNELGIGIITVNGHIVKQKSACKRKYPVSSTSMMFCEWIIRNYNINVENEDGEIRRII